MVQYAASVFLFVSVLVFSHLYAQHRYVQVTELMIFLLTLSRFGVLLRQTLTCMVFTDTCKQACIRVHYLCKSMYAVIRHWFYFRMLYSKICQLAKTNASIGIQLVL